MPRTPDCYWGLLLLGANGKFANTTRRDPPHRTYLILDGWCNTLCFRSGGMLGPVSRNIFTRAWAPDVVCFQGTPIPVPEGDQRDAANGGDGYIQQP